jgi:acetyl-CoA acyltransferase
MNNSSSSRRVVVIDGCRTPFCRSGTAFTDLRSYDLGRMAVSGLIHRTRIDPDAVDLLVMGTVIADPATSNLGREVVLGTQLPDSCPAHTCSVACVSSLQSFLDCARAIQTGDADIAIAAGAETLSDAPIRHRGPESARSGRLSEAPQGSRTDRPPAGAGRTGRILDRRGDG